MSKKKCKDGRPFGRPTKYKPEYCEKLIKHMAKGYSFESFAGVVEVSFETLYQWARVHGEFSEAKKLAFSKNRIFWEQNGIDGMWSDGDKKFNATAWIFNMKNRFGWSDRKDDEGQQRISTVRIELPNAKTEQVISMDEPKKIGPGNEST